MILLERFWQMCLFQTNPADLPSSTWLLKLTLLIYFLVDIVEPVPAATIAQNVLISLIGTVYLFVFSWAVLRLFNLQARLVQTATAHAVCGAIIGLLSLPLFWVLNELTEPSVLKAFISVLLLGLSIWSVLVIAHIYRYALEIGKFSSIMVSIVYNISVFSVVKVMLTLSGV